MNNKMVSREILNSHPIAHLRAEVKKTNVNLTSKMTKSEIIELMMKHSSRFSHITMMEKPKKEKPPPKEKKKAEPKEKKKAEPKKKEKPPPKEKKKAEPKKSAEEERRDKMNKMSPLELFSQLPDVAKRNVERFTGTELGEKFEKLRTIGGINQKKKEMNEIQKKFLNGKYFSLGNFDDETLQAIRKKENGTQILKALSDYMDKEIKKGQKIFEEKEKKANKSIERNSKRDRTKPTETNIFDELIDDEWYEALDQSIENEFESMAWSGRFNYNTATEEQSDRMRERIDNKMSKGFKREMKRLLKEFLKGKKFKTAEEGAAAFRKANPISDIMFSF